MAVCNEIVTQIASFLKIGDLYKMRLVNYNSSLVVSDHIKRYYLFTTLDCKKLQNLARFGYDILFFNSHEAYNPEIVKSYIKYHNLLKTLVHNGIRKISRSGEYFTKQMMDQSWGCMLHLATKTEIKKLPKGVRILYLSALNDVEDVSNLTNCYIIDLSYCCRIKDVSMLGRTHSLKLNFCHQIRDVSFLSEVSQLDLSYCYGIEDVSSLERVKNLKFEGCPVAIDMLS